MRWFWLQCTLVVVLVCSNLPISAGETSSISRDLVLGHSHTQHSIIAFLMQIAEGLQDSPPPKFALFLPGTGICQDSIVL